MFTTIVKQRILHYVYVIKTRKSYYSVKLNRNIDDGNIVYVGQGTGNRVFSHRKESWFLAGDCVEEVIALQLTKETALHVEAALIATLGLNNLENKMLGKQSQKVRTIEEVMMDFDIDPLVLDKEDVGKTLLVVYSPKKEKEVESLYIRATRWWGLNEERAKTIRTIIMMHVHTRKIIAVITNINSITVATDGSGLIAFDNSIKELTFDSKYLGKWVDHLKNKSQQAFQYL